VFAPEAAVIERHITFNVHPDRTEPFERFFADQYAPAMAKAPGFVRVELLREIDSATRYQMMLRFQDADSAAGWRTSEVHQALQPALVALYGDNEIQGYVVIG
jgi:antibiotic biosynthesis monooxygenase (ABM) superfamily enzyme